MAVTLYIPSRYLDAVDALDDAVYSTQEEALNAACDGWYIHTLHVDTNKVIIGKNTLGPLV